MAPLPLASLGAADGNPLPLQKKGEDIIEERNTSVDGHPIAFLEGGRGWHHLPIEKKGENIIEEKNKRVDGHQLFL